MFMYQEDGQFFYKNDCTRQYIVIDRTGKVVREQAEALFCYDMDEGNDPEAGKEESRVVGGGYKEGVSYRSAYWGKTFRVVKIHDPYTAIPWSEWAVTVEWEDGSTSTHCTPLDKKDTVIG